MALAAGCSAENHQRNQREAREAWVREQAQQNPRHAERLALSAAPEADYFESWFPVESDAERTWRWMGKRALVRLKLADSPAGRADVALSVRGWVPHEYLGNAARELTFHVNGQHLDRFEAPDARFVHTFTVPAALIDAEGWIELAIVAANTARPPRDARELGFATSGITWAPATTPPVR